MEYNVINYAREELDKYLSQLGIFCDITLCLFEEKGITDDNVKDSLYDDAIEISVKDGKGYIAGSNERSVLIGVYRYLNELGIKFIRPGKNGTYIPSDRNAIDVVLHEAADKRHRTICIEGGVSLENVAELVDWLPKVGFNGYYIQFNDAFIFFDRWYSHRGNPYLKPESFTVERSLEYVDIIIKEAKKRGLMIQRMGHGWTCEPFGIPNHGWDPVKPEEIPESYVDICAFVNGERKVWLNSPIATQLCYSNPYVRKTMVDGVINYMLDHKDTDIVHFWLGDYPNNSCECPSCIDVNLADFHVMMVNEITDRMKELGLKNKIVLLIYYNTANPPAVERIKSPENTILMFAPISRTFGAAFPDEFKIKSVPKYKVNSFSLPRSVDENLAYLHAWEQCYEGDIVDFDYHLMWDHILDAGGECIARVLSEDAKNLEKLGMNGFISCQLNRNTFPTSIAMTTLARTLWNKDTDFEELKKELYSASFGEESADMLCEYFATLSKAFDIGSLRSQVETNQEVMKADMKAAIDAMENIKPVIKSHLDVDNATRRESWEILGIHTDIYQALGKGILLMLEGDKEGGESLREQSIDIAWRNEGKIQGVLDCQFYQDMTRQRINLDGAVPYI